MAARKKASKKPDLKTRVTKTAQNVGKKVVKTGRDVGGAVGRGAKTAKGKTVAAFGAMKQKIRGKDEEE